MGNSPTKSDHVDIQKMVKRMRKQDHVMTKVQKKQKVEAKSLTLADINYDCLEAIFMQLNLVDLIHVAETDDHFITAATLVFSRRFSKGLVYVNLGSISPRVIVPEIRKDDAAACFRHFGKTLSILFYNSMLQRDIEVEKSLLKHCTELIELELVLCGDNTFDAIENPFKKVENLVMTTCSLSQKLSKLNVWFPNLVSLELSNVIFSQTWSFEINIPHLKHLAIYNKELSIPLSTIIEMCCMNPQIESLAVQCDYDANFLRPLSNHLPKLKILEMWSPDDRFHDFGDEKIIFTSVEKFTLNSFYHWGEFVVNMPFVFTSLKELRLDGFNEFKGHLLGFIIQNEDIEKLSLMTCIADWDDLSHDHLDLIIEMLPNLIELDFCADTFTSNELYQFLSANKNLQIIKLYFVEVPTCPHFVSALEDKWTISNHMVELICIEKTSQYYCLTLERKH